MNQIRKIFNNPTTPIVIKMWIVSTLLLFFIVVVTVFIGVGMKFYNNSMIIFYQWYTGFERSQFIEVCDTHIKHDFGQDNIEQVTVSEGTLEVFVQYRVPTEPFIIWCNYDGENVRTSTQ